MVRMTSGRLEAFADAVIAIVITIMVLELRIPEGFAFSDLRQIAPQFLSYLLSFIFLGIYWNNHHHLFHVVESVDGSVLWANMLLLLWLSLVPFSTAWLGEGRVQTNPVALYGLVLLMAATAYYILLRRLLALHDPDSRLASALGRDAKGKVSLVLDLLGLGLSFVFPTERSRSTSWWPSCGWYRTRASSAPPASPD